MPELPEVEDACRTIERAALDRDITGVDDTDTFVCRPHAPGEIAAALTGRRLTAAHRIGKTIWCETSGVGDHDVDGAAGPVLGVHLGMSGRIVVTDDDGGAVEGGDWLGRAASAAEQSLRTPVWNRFVLRFADGGELRLFDKRRLGRVRLDPDLDLLGPDARRVRLPEFGTRVRGGGAAVKARLLDQSVVAGVGNLLADHVLWQARIDPRRPGATLAEDEVRALHRAVHRSVDVAIRRGGVHTLDFVAHRGREGHCPRCGAELARATVGGRTTYWCPVEQT